MHYENVIPNLECAKLCTYYHNMHEIAVLAPEMTPEPYTKFFIRKEYNDGLFPKELFAPNCTYSGRAFNPDRYAPLEAPIEKTIPNMHLYDKYISHYGKKPTEQAQIKRILNCAHIRLSTDEQNPKTLNQLRRVLDTGRYSGIIFHDYDLGRTKDAYDTIIELSNTRRYRDKDVIRPYPIGNKFPIQVNSSIELDKWLKVNAMANIFFLQYNGLMDDQVLYNLCVENKRMARQVFYNIAPCCYTANDFLINYAPKIFKQVLFLRTQHIKILLIYDENLDIPIEVKNFIELLNYWLSFTWQEGFMPLTQTLYTFCRAYKKIQYTTFAFRTIKMSIDEIRDVFQYIREKNYELFKMFYEWDEVRLEGGKFINVWRRD